MENLDKEVTSKDKKEVLLNAYQKFTEFLNAACELTVLFEEMEDCNEYIANDYVEQALPQSFDDWVTTDLTNWVEQSKDRIARELADRQVEFYKTLN